MFVLNCGFTSSLATSNIRISLPLRNGVTPVDVTHSQEEQLSLLTLLRQSWAGNEWFLGKTETHLSPVNLRDLQSRNLFKGI